MLLKAACSLRNLSIGPFSETIGPQAPPLFLCCFFPLSNLLSARAISDEPSTTFLKLLLQDPCASPRYRNSSSGDLPIPAKAILHVSLLQHGLQCKPFQHPWLFDRGVITWALGMNQDRTDWGITLKQLLLTHAQTIHSSAPRRLPERSGGIILLFVDNVSPALLAAENGPRAFGAISRSRGPPPPPPPRQLSEHDIINFLSAHLLGSSDMDNGPKARSIVRACLNSDAPDFLSNASRNHSDMCAATRGAPDSRFRPDVAHLTMGP
ncbi:hypothetical protein C8R46DRAFT_1262681 [Mycena filopes]|nr:hypothetical protein C8R46DRAFT_1262681 [Mycena filopes]